MIEKKSGVKDRFLRDIQVYDAFSFITVAYNDAETIIREFKKTTRGKRPIVEMAKTERKKK